MRFAIFTSMGGTTWNDVLDLWRHADQAGGWDAACVTDHFMPNTADRVGDMLESWTALAALAGLTKRMRVGTIVSGNTYRHPAVLAKMATTVDIISGGRLIFGIGAGWFELEHQQYGIPFHTLGTRLRRLDEARHAPAWARQVTATELDRNDLPLGQLCRFAEGGKEHHLRA